MNKSASHWAVSPRDPRVPEPDPGLGNPRARRRHSLDLNLLRAYGQEVLDWMATDEDLADLSLVVPSQTPNEGLSASPGFPAFTRVTLDLPQLLTIIQDPSGIIF